MKCKYCDNEATTKRYNVRKDMNKDSFPFDDICDTCQSIAEDYWYNVIHPMIIKSIPKEKTE